jgi:hypothetical protein
MIDRGLMLTTQAIRRQLAAMPHDLYLIRLIQNRTHQALPGKRLWTATQLFTQATIGFLRARNREGYDIYIRPDAWDQNAGYILVDLDRADANVLHRMRRTGHQPCLVLQTSPGHLQAWVQVTVSGLEPCIATAVARLLAREYGGDVASADWRHMGRLAGFTNQKPALRTDCGAPWVKVVFAGAGTASNADALVKAAMNLWRPSWLPTDARHPNRPDGLSSTTPGEAAAIYRDCLNQWRIAERFAPTDWSIVDLWVARHLLSQGVQPAEVEDILQLGSPQFPRRHGNANDYLRRTVGRATFPLKWAPV